MALAESPEAQPALGAAIENGIRTMLALTALDAKHSKTAPGPRLVTREVGGARVTSLEGGSRPFAYVVGAGFLALGTSAEAVSAFAGEPSEVPAVVSRLRSAYFPEAETYAVADVAALTKLAELNREALISRFAGDRGEAAARRDLDAVLAVMGLFRSAYASGTVSADSTSAHRRLGLVLDSR